MAKRKLNQWQSEKAKIEDNKGDYVVELGTYLPIQKRVQDLKAAGMDLMAYRQAYADFVNGTQEINLDDYDDELMGIDEIDFMKKKARYLEIMHQQAEIAKNREIEKQKRNEELIQKGLESEKKAKENTTQDNNTNIK